MRVTITSGGRTVDIRAGRDQDGDRRLLRAVERTALRLLAALPEPAPPGSDGESEEGQPFGFALSADTERAEPPLLRDHEPDEYEEPDWSAP
ncbi:MAG TPA: hypothetical protein VFY14_06625 [Streptomyces sp.]|nr:hypothetical protein [Streptomyces sp.]